MTPAMSRLHAWPRFVPLPLTVKLMAVNVLLVLALAAVVWVAWRTLPAEAGAAADVILLTNAQRSNLAAGTLHDLALTERQRPRDHRHSDRAAR